MLPVFSSLGLDQQVPNYFLLSFFCFTFLRANAFSAFFLFSPLQQHGIDDMTCCYGIVLSIFWRFRCSTT